MKKRLQQFFIAVQFLTRVPVPRLDNINKTDIGQSMLFYPLVGLFIGLALWGIAWLTGDDSLLSAALVLGFWVLITGALHLDGLADSADAWIGGNNDTKRSLAIMKDPRAGPIAVTVLVVLLLLKFSAIEAIVASGQMSALLLAPIIGRACMPLLLLTTPYVRSDGLASAMVDKLPSAKSILIVLTLCVLFILSFGYTGIVSILISVVCFIITRKQLMRWINGTTGDTAGALLEIVETTVLISIALSL